MSAGIVNCATINEFYQTLVPVLSDSSTDILVGDLRGITWFQSFHLTMCATLKTLSNKTNKKFTFTKCGSPDTENYAGRMGLFDGTKNNDGSDFEYKYKKHTSDRFFDLKYVDSDNNQDIYSSLAKVLSNNCPSMLPDVFESFTEMIDNIYFHSGISEDSGWGFAHAQCLSNNLHLAVCDLGVGYFETYKRNNLLKNRTSLQIVEDSLKLQESCRNITNSNRGLGLNHVCNYLDDSRGQMTIYTDGIQCEYKNQQAKIRPLGYETKGVLACITIPLAS